MSNEKYRFTRLVIEYINGDIEDICCDHYCEKETSIEYRSIIKSKDDQIILKSVGVDHISFSSIKKWTVELPEKKYS